MLQTDAILDERSIVIDATDDGFSPSFANETRILRARQMELIVLEGGFIMAGGQRRPSAPCTLGGGRSAASEFPWALNDRADDWLIN